jgi:hypothetical protein
MRSVFYPETNKAEKVRSDYRVSANMMGARTNALLRKEAQKVHTTKEPKNPNEKI